MHVLERKRLLAAVAATTLTLLGTGENAIALIADYFLRIEVGCPSPLGDGVLEIREENVDGAQGKITWTYLDGRVVRVISSESPDGVTFSDWTLDRPENAEDRDACYLGRMSKWPMR